jgi:hypothetical protein
MSQFTLTAEEDAIVLDALRSKANEYHNLYGATDPTLEALVAKVLANSQSQPPWLKRLLKLRKPKHLPLTSNHGNSNFRRSRL